MVSLRSRQRLQVRAEIVHTAFELFAELGYDKVSVDAIAAKAGISRATFFNYFPQKELILREIASDRASKLKGILDDFHASGGQPTFQSVIALIVNLAGENARIGAHSKKLLLETFFNSASQGLLMDARDTAVKSVAQMVGRIPQRKKIAPRLVAESLFAVYMATMLEWLMRERASQQWLLRTLRERLLLLVEGVE